MITRRLSSLLISLPLVLAACDQSPVGVASSALDASSAAPAIDAQYAALLRELVNEDGLVRYALLSDESRRARLDAVVAGYSTVARPQDDQQRLALWCNAYNANALAMAWRESRNPSFESVRNVEGFLDRQPLTVAGETQTLDSLKAEVRRMKDPRIHAALVCGAMGCPPLRREPYSPARLGLQLDDQSRRWLEDWMKNRAEPRDKLRLSQIFEWHADDFQVEPYHGAIGFIRAHARPRGQLVDFIKHVSNFKLGFIPYDWKLNQAVDDGAEAGEPEPGAS